MIRSVLFTCLALILFLSPRAALAQSPPTDAEKPTAESKPAAPNKNVEKPKPADAGQPAGAAFIDLDRDGDLDILVAEQGVQVLLTGKDGRFEAVLLANNAIGATLSPASDTLRAQLKIADGQGLVVTEVTADSLAAKAGLQVDDVLLTAGDRPLAKPTDVSDVVNSPVKKPFTVEFTLLRGGERRKVPLSVAETSFASEMLAEVISVPDRPQEPTFRIGVEVSDAGSTLRAQLKLPKGQGIVIDRVLPDTPAQKIGFQPYDILVTVDGKPLEKSEDLSAAVKASEGKPLKFSLVRSGQRIEISVTPEKRSSDREALIRWVMPTRTRTRLLLANERVTAVRTLPLAAPAASDTAAQIERMLKQINQLRDEMKALQSAVAKEQKAGPTLPPKPAPPSTDLPKAQTPKK